MLKRRLFYLFFLLSFFLQPQPTLAAKTYNISHQTTYRLQTDKLTATTHYIKLTNLLANIYPTSYTISIGANNLQNIRVQVNQQPVKPRITADSQSTTITFPIVDPQIGKDQTNSIVISYLNPQIVEQIGNTYEINLPKLAKANEATLYQRQLIIPKDLPPLTLSLPAPTKTDSDSQTQTLTWTGFPNQNISLLFGRHQTYRLNLTYHLNNTNLQNSLTEIALPPDTPYQRVYLDHIDPQPLSIKVDRDGNWLAQYDLTPNQPLTVTATLYVQVYPQPQLQLPPLTSDLAYLTQPTQFWPSQDKEIKRLAQQLKTPTNVYNYLVSHFVYNYSRINQPKRLGATTALKNPHLAICTEFTDTFIALTRSLGIPAREINGYAYTTNPHLKPLSLQQDVLHAWPEYYDHQSQQWLAVDPTWGNTTGGVDYFNKLDFNHITFVRHGQDDSYPLPAGAYKSDPKTKSFTVTIAPNPPQPRLDYKIKGNTLINTGNLSIINQTLSLPNGRSVTIDYLPPYGQQPLSPTTRSTATSSFPANYLLPLSVALILTLLLGAYLKLRP